MTENFLSLSKHRLLERHNKIKLLKLRKKKRSDALLFRRKPIRMEVHFLSRPTMARRKWRAILWGLMEKHCQVWDLYSVKIAFRYEGEGRDISQMKRNTENSFLEKLFWRILKENSIGRKKMIAERGLKFQKEKKIMIGTHSQNVTSHPTSCESFLNEYMMIEAKIINICCGFQCMYRKYLG